MEFAVMRTSTYVENTKPCEETNPKTLTWRICGKKETVTGEKTAWLITFSDLQEFLNFVKKYKPVTLDETDFEGIDFEIEICDEFD